MVTALILQLVQCIVTPPNNDDDLSLLRPDTPSDTTSDTSNKVFVIILNYFELSLSLTHCLSLRLIQMCR